MNYLSGSTTHPCPVQKALQRFVAGLFYFDPSFLPFRFLNLGGSRAFSGSPQLPVAGPAGLRGLLKSPPHLAGQAPPTLRATRFNPCRKPQDPSPYTT
jgi:hypothetical protein